VTNLIKAFIHFPKFLKALLKAKQVDVDVALARLAVCLDCPDLDTTTRQCRHCWCFVRLKVQWEDEHCDLKKW